MRTSVIRTLLLLTVALATGVTATRANPTGGQVTAGSATISGEGTSGLTVNQATPRVVIDWQSFSIGSGESATFIQPDASSIALNRVIGSDPSQILGSLTSNGTVILVNRNGILFGESARVDVGGLVATTHDIGNDAFMTGGLLRFDRAGDPQASVVNKGTISIRNAGLAAFVAPHVVNDGIITANYGRVSLGAGTAFTLDLYGDELISFAIGDEVTQTITNADGTNAKALVENAGRISATEGRIQLTAAAARAVVNQSVNVSGIVEANSLSTTGGRIVLKGSGTVMTERSAQVTAEGHTGGEIRVEGNAVHLDGRVSVDGSQEAPRSVAAPNFAAAERLRSRNLDQAYEDRGTTPESTPGGRGGSLFFQGQSFVSLDGALSASGWQGGAVEVIAARNFALNGQVNATGGGAAGGRVSIHAARETWEGSGSGIDVSGATGGSITNVTGAKFVTSASYLATGTAGTGGRIDVTGGDMFLLSSTYDASGLTGGGSVRLGGEYQGGKNLTTDEIPNARRLAANDGLKIDVSAKGNHGDAGTAIIWSDEKTTFLGSVYATGGLLSGVGGLVEASSADTLIWRGTVETAVNGERGGTLLLDPKNITIADGSFSQLQLILGAFAGGPLGGAPPLRAEDHFGSAVSLNGTRLAVGAVYDDGATSFCSNCGAVYLFKFADHGFSGGTLTARIGHGYTGSKDVNLAGTLGVSDNFGSAVSLDGSRLAVGAWADDGATNTCGGCGAVYLFTFTDTSFTGGTLAGRIGAGYAGGKDVNLTGTLESNHFFGSSVSLDGTRLAIGAPDNGATNSCSDCGAVYLFTFTDHGFSEGTLTARIGHGYTGSKDVSLAGILGVFDYFGSSVSLDGTRLAVGAYSDDGAANACDGFSASGCGAVYLFNFADHNFSGGALTARIGHGYTGSKDVNLAGILGVFDYFGSSVSLDGTRLAVGAPNDFGATDTCTLCGAVYLFDFADQRFSGGTLTTRIGHGYTGGNDINLAGTRGSAGNFGSAVSLDGGRLAVGDLGDESTANSCFRCGAAYLFTLGDGTSLTSNVAYADTAFGNMTISPSQITGLLNAGTAVVLQASNDITVSNAITAANPGGDGGVLTLQAGRSILVNANIVTDNGNLTLIANDLLANGVVDAYREPGAAVITMAAGTSINAGTGTVLFDLRSGAGKTHSTGGAITLTSVTASSITARNAAASNGDIVLAPGGVLNATSSGNAVVLAASDQFLNNAGAGAITTPSGRFVIYSQNWNADTRGGLTGSNLYNRTYAANPPASLTPAGNLFVYSAQPILTVTANAASRTYGAANPAFSASITGLVNGDSAGYAYAGAAGFSTTTTASSNVGTYVGDVLPNIGTLTSAVGYGFSFAGGNLAIDPASLIITASNASKTYGQTASLTNFTTSGLLFSDSVTGLSLSSLGTVNTANVGGYAINASGATGAGLSNYAISYVSGLLSVNPALLTITANDASKRYGQQLEFAGTEFTTSGFLFSDVVSSVSLSSLGAPRRSAAGSYAITPSAAIGLGLSNYMISYVDGTLTVTGGPRLWVPQPVSGDAILPFEAGFPLFCAIDGTWPVQANESTQIMTACAGN